MKRRPLLLMLASASTLANAGAPLVFPMHEPGRESHWRYLLAVLKLAAERAGTDHEFLESQEPMTQAAALLVTKPSALAAGSRDNA